MAEKEVGKVMSYFSKVEVAAVKLNDTLRVGDMITIKGATTNFTQEVESMQIDREEVPEATAGDEVGIKVAEKVRPNDLVYLAE
ncbi:MAG: translation elongation factor-like protein [Candidatus Pacearchaeota archaeon]